MKKMIIQTVRTFTVFDLEMSLAELNTFINELINEHGAKAKLEWAGQFRLINERPETDKEEARRIKANEKAAKQKIKKTQQIEQRELKLLEKLQIKYNKV